MERKLRFPILGISHETNTFSRVIATYEKFEEALILRGQELVDQYAESEYTVAGYLQAAGELGFEVVPLMYAQTGPIGTITKDAYDRLSTEMLGMLRDQGPWDGVLICNHGAAVSEEFPDMDAEFTRAVREIVVPMCQSASPSTCTPISRRRRSPTPMSAWSGGPVPTSTPGSAVASAPS